MTWMMLGSLDLSEVSCRTNMTVEKTIPCALSTCPLQYSRPYFHCRLCIVCSPSRSDVKSVNEWALRIIEWPGPCGNGRLDLCLTKPHGNY